MRLFAHPPATKLMFKDADVVFLFYSASDGYGFDELEERLAITMAHVDATATPVFLLALQCDERFQQGNTRVVTQQQGEEFVQKHHLSGYFECSAFDGTGLLEPIFAAIASRITGPDDPTAVLPGVVTTHSYVPMEL